jgi:hypothetical protein
MGGRWLRYDWSFACCGFLSRESRTSVKLCPQIACMGLWQCSQMCLGSSGALSEVSDLSSGSLMGIGTSDRAHRCRATQLSFIMVLRLSYLIVWGKLRTYVGVGVVRGKIGFPARILRSSDCALYGCSAHNMCECTYACVATVPAILHRTCCKLLAKVSTRSSQLLNSPNKQRVKSSTNNSSQLRTTILYYIMCSGNSCHLLCWRQGRSGQTVGKLQGVEADQSFVELSSNQQDSLISSSRVLRSMLDSSKVWRPIDAWLSCSDCCVVSV